MAKSLEPAALAHTLAAIAARTSEPGTAQSLMEIVQALLEQAGLTEAELRETHPPDRLPPV